MWTLNQLADRIDRSTKTARRWTKFLNCPPDQPGHNCNLWSDETADRFFRLYNDFYKHRGTTPEIVKLKALKRYKDKKQLRLPLL
jgi:hypothetical protein